MSKILKQNGTNGKILRAQQSGKVMKQNYNFGNYFMPKGTIKLRANFSYNINEDFTLLFWPLIFGTPFYNAVKTDLTDTEFGVFCDGSSTNAQARLHNKASNMGNLIRKLVGLQMDTSIPYYVNGSKFSLGAATLVDKSFTYIDFRGNSATNYMAFTGISFFNRALNIDEIAYEYNNGLGNDFLNTMGLQFFYRCQLAELLDFSIAQDGSDIRVGIRDETAYNRHGELLNLPAGTLQEQLDYANLNLFGLW